MTQSATVARPPAPGTQLFQRQMGRSAVHELLAAVESLCTTTTCAQDNGACTCPTPEPMWCMLQVCRGNTTICTDNAICDGTATCPDNPVVPASDRKVGMASAVSCTAWRDPVCQHAGHRRNAGPASNPDHVPRCRFAVKARAPATRLSTALAPAPTARQQMCALTVTHPSPPGTPMRRRSKRQLSVELLDRIRGLPLSIRLPLLTFKLQ